MLAAGGPAHRRIMSRVAVGAGDRQREAQRLLGIGLHGADVATAALAEARHVGGDGGLSVDLLGAIGGHDTHRPGVGGVQLACRGLIEREARPHVLLHRDFDLRAIDVRSEIDLHLGGDVGGEPAAGHPPVDRVIGLLDELLGQPGIRRIDRLLVVLVDVADQLGDLVLRFQPECRVLGRGPAQRDLVGQVGIDGGAHPGIDVLGGKVVADLGRPGVEVGRRRGAVSDLARLELGLVQLLGEIGRAVGRVDVQLGLDVLVGELLAIGRQLFVRAGDRLEGLGLELRPRRLRLRRIGRRRDVHPRIGAHLAAAGRWDVAGRRDDLRDLGHQ